MTAAMPPKDWAKVTANVLRAKTAIDELRAHTTAPEDLERLRVAKLALFDLDILQSELHALAFGLAREGHFTSLRGRCLRAEADRRSDSITAAHDAEEKPR